MATFCSPYTLQSSISTTDGIKNGKLFSFSPDICRKRNSPFIRSVYPHRRCITHRTSPCDALNDSIRRRIKNSLQEEAQTILEKQHNGFKFLFRTEFGGLVKVFVGAIEMKYTVYIKVHSLPQSMISHDLILSWGMFRSDSLVFQGSDSPISVSSMKTPFVKESCRLDFDHSSAPFYLSFLLLQPDGTGFESIIRTHRKTNFCVPVGLGPGYPMPLGVSLSNDGSTNFSLFSRNAKSVVLCLYESEASEPTLELDLDPYVNRTGDIWHVSIDNITNYILYGYRCKGDIHARCVLLDPYAKVIRNLSSYDQGDSASMAKSLGYLHKEPNFDWSGDTRPQIPMEKLVVYHLNVENFTKSESSGVDVNIAGTFTGVVKKVQHLKNLGINAVLFEPLFSFNKKKGPYFPYHFFSPMSMYGNMYSMKEMVKILHSHGIEVLLEVVFTHTCEVGDSESERISLLGIDNSSYYVVDGNVSSKNCSRLRCNNAIVDQMILDSLHHWVTEYHIDGFCFVNSSSLLLQGSNGNHLPRPPLIEDIAFDPLLSETKIISDCWSPVDMSYKDAIFPHWQRWAEMNSKYFHDIRNFLRGQGLLSQLATRLCGSGDIFTDSRGPSYSLNYITRNAGLTLVDLVSYSSADLASELSWNCGEEGPTDENSVLEIRLRQVRNFLFILFVSIGVPVINMGDECGHSSAGSPSYNKGPIDWSSLRTGFSEQITKFVAFLASLRDRRSDIFQRKEFYKAENIAWHGSNQSPPKWKDPSCKFLAMELKAEKDVTLPNSHNGDLFIVVNGGGHPEMVTLPESPEGFIWFRLVDTSRPYPNFFASDSNPNSRKIEGLSSYELKPHTCALFEARIFYG